MEVAMAATYDPDPKAPLGFRLPVDLRHRELIAKRWASGATTIPSISSAATRGTLRTLSGIYIDCGGATSTTSISARASCRGSSQPTASGILRGIRRHALVDRLPDGHEPAVSLQVAQTLKGPPTMPHSITDGRRMFALALLCSPSAFADANVPSPTTTTPISTRRRGDQGQGLGRGGQVTCEAREAEPANADAQNLLGYAYRNQKKFDLAFKHYGEALRLDPKHKGAHEYIGEAYV
jgi:hypothetical protein